MKKFILLVGIIVLAGAGFYFLDDYKPAHDISSTDTSIEDISSATKNINLEKNLLEEEHVSGYSMYEGKLFFDGLLVNEIDLSTAEPVGDSHYKDATNWFSGRQQVIDADYGSYRPIDGSTFAQDDSSIFRGGRAIIEKKTKDESLKILSPNRIIVGTTLIDEMGVLKDESGDEVTVDFDTIELLFDHDNDVSANIYADKNQVIFRGEVLAGDYNIDNFIVQGENRYEINGTLTKAIYDPVAKKYSFAAVE